MGELKKWLDQKWVRIGTDGSIKGECGTSKDKKNPDRCLPAAKARSLSKKDRAATAKKKKKAGKKAKQSLKTPKKQKLKTSKTEAKSKQPSQKGRSRGRPRKVQP